MTIRILVAMALLLIETNAILRKQSVGLVVTLCLCNFCYTTECGGSDVVGKTVDYIFNVRYITGNPDGVRKQDQVLSINGLFPGPVVTATAGDTIRVTVINSIQDGQNTSIHWHGVHQRDTPFEDGTNMIAQCPIKNGHNQTYVFHVPLAGTYWYHAHTRSQYVEGLWGALIVKKPTELYEYDDEIVIMLSDWYHHSAHELEEWHLSTRSRGAPPFPDSALMNGRGRANCTLVSPAHTCNPTQQKRPVWKVRPGGTYRIRLINTSGYAGFRFAIDGHKLCVIEMDARDTLRHSGVDVIEVASAQRYSFLVTMNGSEDAYIVRADMMTEALFVDGDNINLHPGGVMPNATGRILYERNSNVDISYTTENFDFNQPLPPSTFNRMEKPHFSGASYLRALDGIEAPGDFHHEYTLVITFAEDAHGVRRGGFNNVSFRLPDDKPLLWKMIEGDPFPPNNNPLYLRYGDVIQLVVNNPFNGRHPVHLHGHSFWVMGTGAQGAGPYNPGVHDFSFHGPRRDTVVVQQQSWLVLRFLADNPGLWAVHCHIDWHNLSGMAAVFVEAANMTHTLTIPDEARRVCAAHDISLSGDNATTLSPAADLISAPVTDSQPPAAAVPTSIKPAVQTLPELSIPEPQSRVLSVQRAVRSSSNEVSMNFTCDGAQSGNTFAYPAKGSYRRNQSCAVHLTAPIGRILEIKFTRFKLEDHYRCGYDWLDVVSAGKAMGRYCGKGYPRGATLVSLDRTLILRFHSDSSANFEGFAVVWQAIDPGQYSKIHIYNEYFPKITVNVGEGNSVSTHQSGMVQTLFNSSSTTEQLSVQVFTGYKDATPAAVSTFVCSINSSWVVTGSAVRAARFGSTNLRELEPNGAVHMFKKESGLTTQF